MEMDGAHTAEVDGEVGSDAANDAARLRAESDAFQAHLERLNELEVEKRQMAPSDPGFVTLALEVEQLAATVLNDARGQTELGQAAHLDGITMPIVDVPDSLTAVQILAQWRDSERQLADESPSSDRARELRAQIDAYRRAYQGVFKRDEDQPRTV